MPGAAFNEAAEASKKLNAKPNTDELLQLYSHFKQAQQNPTFENAPTPGTFDLKGKAKHKAWKKLVDEGVTPEQAEEKYVALVNSLKDKYGYDPNKVPEKVGSD